MLWRSLSMCDSDGWHGQVFLAMEKQIELTETNMLKST